MDLRLVENLPGWYRVFAIERMALSRTVCVYIKDDLMISSEPSCIKQRLADFVCKRMVKDV